MSKNKKNKAGVKKYHMGGGDSGYVDGQCTKPYRVTCNR
jgi:hypothetical protein